MPQTTHDVGYTYSHVLPSMQETAVEAMETALS
jgi:hypothetical protein